jgi:hypothetical protein
MFEVYTLIRTYVWGRNGKNVTLFCETLVTCEVRTEFIYVMWNKVDRLCGLMVGVPGYTTEMYCASCEVRTEFIYVM